MKKKKFMLKLFYFLTIRLYLYLYTYTNTTYISFLAFLNGMMIVVIKTILIKVPTVLVVTPQRHHFNNLITFSPFHLSTLLTTIFKYLYTEKKKEYDFLHFKIFWFCCCYVVFVVRQRRFAYTNNRQKKTPLYLFILLFR